MFTTYVHNSDDQTLINLLVFPIHMGSSVLDRLQALGIQAQDTYGVIVGRDTHSALRLNAEDWAHLNHVASVDLFRPWLDTGITAVHKMPPLAA